MAKAKELDLNSIYQLSKIASGVDYLSLHDLIGLKEGTHDPTPQFVCGLKKLIGVIADETEIDQYLVQPFLEKHKTYRK